MTKQCPICREVHDPERGLSYDGCGINSCGTYRDRLATFGKSVDGLTSGLLGPMFAASPALVAAAKEFLRLDCRYDDLTAECAAAKVALRDAVLAAEGGPQ